MHQIKTELACLVDDLEDVTPMHRSNALKFPIYPRFGTKIQTLDYGNV